MAARTDLVPAEPLQALVRQRSSRELAAAYAQRYGCLERTGLTQLRRLLAALVVPLATADRWCTLLGVHISHLWPELDRG